MTSFAKAYTNIALIKYWGKKDQQLLLPQNSSISLTLDAFYTETFVTFTKNNSVDTFTLNGQLQNAEKSQKVFQFLDYARSLAQTNWYANVSSTNFVPTAAGLASSASGMAALAGAVSLELDLPTDAISLSRLARHGSGSATRSIYGGFAEWQMGHDDATSYAISLKEDVSAFDLAMVFILVDSGEKKISSRVGMQRTVATSAYYPGWLATINDDLAQARLAIAENNFTNLGTVMEANALKMHASMMAAVPPFTYWMPDSLKAMQLITGLRAQGLPVYFTMDAGPNVKALVERANLKPFLAELEKAFPKEKIVVAFPGKGIELKKES